MEFKLPEVSLKDRELLCRPSYKVRRAPDAWYERSRAMRASAFPAGVLDPRSFVTVND